MSGTKTIVNNSALELNVILRGRHGEDPQGVTLPPVSAKIAPHGSATLQYGDDHNPYLNTLEVEETSNGARIHQAFSVTARGGPGTLDALFNTNSTIAIVYDAAHYGFDLSAHN